MQKILLASALLAALAACSSKKEAAPEAVETTVPAVAEAPVELPPPPAETFEPHWARDNTSPEDTEQQLSRCRYDVGMNAANLESSRVNSLIDDCMKKEGYRWVSE